MENDKPFLRWAGGKRWLARSLAPLVRSRLAGGGVYYEPFMGSGAVFFALDPTRAVLSDLNNELIITFREVAHNATGIIEALSRMPATKAEYERVRGWQPTSPTDKAVRFIYLNRNCWGGLYRENMSGVFNVPYGGGSRNHNGVCRNGAIERAATILNRPGVELRACDFEAAVKCAGAGDVIYCDPTYREVTRKQFDRYGPIIFRWEDQQRLATLALEAFGRGAVVILSNTTCNEVRALYPGAAVIEARRRKGLGPSIGNHGQVEYLMILDPVGEWSQWAQIGPLEEPTGGRWMTINHSISNNGSVKASDITTDLHVSL